MLSEKGSRQKTAPIRKLNFIVVENDYLVKPLKKSQCGGKAPKKVFGQVEDEQFLSRLERERSGGLIDNSEGSLTKV